MKKFFFVAFLALIFVAATVAAARLPWHRRISDQVETIHLTAHRNTPIELWPDEPDLVYPVEPKRFSRALGELCGAVPVTGMKVPKSRLDNFTNNILKQSKAFDVDPFLLAALVYDQSKCWPKTPKRDDKMNRHGLTRIPVTMHARQIKNENYNYYLRGKDSQWKMYTLPLKDYRFNKWTAKKTESNLYFAAAFMSILKKQARDLDDFFEKEDPHRHYISHWFYGDRILCAEPENRVLTARRRMLEYYKETGRKIVIGNYKGNNLVSPLDGTPRLVLDYFGNPRGKKGTRGHRGIDIDGAIGEPVRAISSGRVTFAGVDLHGGGAHKILTPDEASKLTNSQMGPGGLYVSIKHENSVGTIYMHLHSIAVNHWDEVKAGQIIGTLGRSGTEKSGAHLHLEFRVNTDRADPSVPLTDILVNPYKDKSKND